MSRPVSHVNNDIINILEILLYVWFYQPWVVVPHCGSFFFLQQLVAHMLKSGKKN